MADLLIKGHDFFFMGAFQGFGLGIPEEIRESFQNLLLPLQELGIVDLMLEGQLGYGFLFFRYFENDPDLQFDGITLSKSAHNVLKNLPDFCLNFPIHYNPPLRLEPGRVGGGAATNDWKIKRHARMNRAS